MRAPRAVCWFVRQNLPNQAMLCSCVRLGRAAGVPCIGVYHERMPGRASGVSRKWTGPPVAFVILTHGAGCREGCSPHDDSYALHLVRQSAGCDANNKPPACRQDRGRLGAVRP